MCFGNLALFPASIPHSYGQSFFDAYCFEILNDINSQYYDEN
ncbi:12686_t:CDS:1, partial [Gigaspora rosea]